MEEIKNETVKNPVLNIEMWMTVKQLNNILRNDIVGVTSSVVTDKEKTEGVSNDSEILSSGIIDSAFLRTLDSTKSAVLGEEKFLSAFPITIEEKTNVDSSEFPISVRNECANLIINGTEDYLMYNKKDMDRAVVRTKQTENGIERRCRFAVRDGIGKILETKVTPNEISSANTYYWVEESMHPVRTATSKFMESDIVTLARNKEGFEIKRVGHAIRKSKNNGIWIQDSILSRIFDENGIEMSIREIYTRYPAQDVQSEEGFDYTVQPEVDIIDHTRIGIDLVRSEETINGVSSTRYCAIGEDTYNIAMLGCYTLLNGDPDVYETPQDKLEEFRKRNPEATSILEEKFAIGKSK